jgi:hypothetical protein
MKKVKIKSKNKVYTLFFGIILIQGLLISAGSVYAWPQGI